MAKIVSDVEDYHAHSTNLEAQTKAAGIKQLAFYHFVPVPNNPLILKIFERGLSGNTIFTMISPVAHSVTGIRCVICPGPSTLASTPVNSVVQSVR